MLADDCSGPFDPGFELNQLSRRALCVLGREWLLHGHMQDRVGMPLLLERGGREEMEAAAIDEWMGASPVYSRRVQRALSFGGDGVDTIFKNLQLDIGAPHQFLDFRYQLHDASSGEFRLAFCGALMDVEPMGDDFVRGMCHTIEDPTFDATAGSVNPYAQVRPIHRPPRIPAGRTPHCHWSVKIGDGPPVHPHPNVELVERSVAASITLPAPEPSPDAEPGGLADYSGPFDPGRELEDYSQDALLTVLNEVAMQSHLLFRSYLLTVSQRFGDEAAKAVAPRVFTGLVGLTSQRLRKAMKLPEGVQGIARLLQIHPIFAPRGYVNSEIEIVDDDRVRFTLSPCPALEEPDELTWFAHLADDPASVSGLETLMHGIEPRATVRALDTGVLAYEIQIDPQRPPASEPPEVQLAKVSTGANFRFRERRPLRS